MRILQYLIEGKDFDYTLTDLLNANVSWGTLNSLVPKLLELEEVSQMEEVPQEKVNLVSNPIQTSFFLVS